MSQIDQALEDVLNKIKEGGQQSLRDAEEQTKKMGN
jgi:hypothetical protein